MHHHEEEEKYVSAEEYYSVLREYWRVVEESDGFDLENVSIPPHMSGMITGLRPFDCSKLYPFRTLVNLYARLGLHRYNILEGTNFQLASLVKFNMTQNCVCSYYMTLLAYDPAAGPLDKTFQVQIDEQRYGSLDFTCSIARLKEPVTIKEPYIPHFHGAPPAYGIFKGELPGWPSDDDLKDETRFYMVKESEWEDTDWIFMYLELVVVANDRFIEDLSRLTIVNVAIETSIEDAEQQNERLNAKSANVYITFKGLAEPRAGRQTFEVGEHVVRKAIVRRVLSESTGNMSLMGKLCGGNEEQCSSMTSHSVVKVPDSLFCRNGVTVRGYKKRPRLG